MTKFESYVVVFCILMFAGFVYGLVIGGTRYSGWDITLIVVLVGAAFAVRKARVDRQSASVPPAADARVLAAGKPATSSTPGAPALIPWNDPSLKITSDSARTARYRALQSWYWEVHLGVPPGLDRRGLVIASMLPAEEVARTPALNFITPEAADYASQRAGQVLRAGGTLEEDRLRRNMLSSMPLCFNIFGSLRDEPTLPALLREVFGIDAQSVENVECEWAPDKALHLNDRIAFGAFVEYRDSTGRRCFLAIETKYTEPFGRKVYDSARYREVTETTGHFRSRAAEALADRLERENAEAEELAANDPLIAQTVHLIRSLLAGENAPSNKKLEVSEKVVNVLNAQVRPALASLIDAAGDAEISVEADSDIEAQVVDLAEDQ